MTGRLTSAYYLVAALAAVALAACQTVGDTASTQSTGDAVATAEAAEQADQTYSPSNEPLRLALQNFHRGNHGLAERYFRDAVEKSPNDVTAWIGLAASYDHIRRFDLADRAYATAVRLAGETAQILNNQGYSYLLRGDLRGARVKFEKARRRDPDNTTIVHNLEILKSKSEIRRSAL